ncbi:unnamed protein product [Prunus armeniaca]
MVPAEGSPMLKSAMSGKFGRVTVKDFVQVAVVVTRVLEIKFGSWELWQSGALAGVWHLGRVSSFGRGEGVSTLVLVFFRLDMLG